VRQSPVLSTRPGCADTGGHKYPMPGGWHHQRVTTKAEVAVAKADLAIEALSGPLTGRRPLMVGRTSAERMPS
jgi:hypothetical protein